MSNKILHMMVGLPFSGKTTAARRMGHPIVCPDAIRIALHGRPYIESAEPIVWATARLMVASLFLAGHDAVILDACNGTRKRRDEWKSPDWHREFCTLYESADVCKARATEAGRQDIIPVIERMACSFEFIEIGETL